jgi:hypothetical protein
MVNLGPIYRLIFCYSVLFPLSHPRKHYAYPQHTEVDLTGYRVRINQGKGHKDY